MREQLRIGRAVVAVVLAAALAITIPIAVVAWHYSRESGPADGPLTTATVQKVLDCRQANAWSCEPDRNLAARVAFRANGVDVLSDVAVSLDHPPQPGSTLLVQYRSGNPAVAADYGFQESVPSLWPWVYGWIGVACSLFALGIAVEWWRGRGPRAPGDPE
jgi:hypothetical protein